MGGQSEKMLGEHCRIRNSLKGILAKEGLPYTRVLDTLGAITGKNTVASQLEVLKSITAKDNVHLTSSGYRFAEGILREAAYFDMPKCKGKHSLTGKQPIHSAEWHGFVCNNGVGKISGKVPKKPFGRRPHPYLKKK
jgi:hypothetical protein